MYYVFVYTRIGTFFSKIVLLRLSRGGNWRISFFLFLLRGKENALPPYKTETYTQPQQRSCLNTISDRTVSTPQLSNASLYIICAYRKKHKKKPLISSISLNFSGCIHLVSRRVCKTLVYLPRSRLQCKFFFLFNC